MKIFQWEQFFQAHIFSYAFIIIFFYYKAFVDNAKRMNVLGIADNYLYR